jgi:hypothetical protein
LRPMKLHRSPTTARRQAVAPSTFPLRKIDTLPALHCSKCVDLVALCRIRLKPECRLNPPKR